LSHRRSAATANEFASCRARRVRVASLAYTIIAVFACARQSEPVRTNASPVQRSGSLSNAPDRPTRVEVTETVFERTIVDPFRWMEDSARKGDMVAWVTAASASARTQLSMLPGRAKLAALLDSAASPGVGYSNVQEANGRLFALRLDPNASRSKLVMRSSAAEERVLFDPSLGPNGPVSISNYAVSPGGTTIAVHTAAGGGEVGSIRFLDADSGRWRDDVLEPVWGEIAASWIDDELVLFTRMALTRPGDPLQHMSVRLHKLGQPASSQRALLSQEGPQRVPVASEEFPIATSRPLSEWTLGFLGGARADARYLVASDADVRAGRAEWREVITYDDRVGSADLRGNDVFYVTTRRTPNGELRRTDARTGTASSSSLVLAGGSFVLQSVIATVDGIYLVTLDNGINRLLFLRDGAPPARQVELDAGSILATRTTGDGRRLMLALITWTRPSRQLEVESGVVRSLGIESASFAGAKAVEAVEDEAISSDGTRVPMAILQRRGVRHDGSAATLLDGYGSYGFAYLTPYYSSRVIAWVNHGGVYAYCGTRGGGEKGRTWHEAGRAANKPNAHADFIACAERLIALGITKPATLAITGASAAGALVAPAALKRPDLFRAVVPQVAFLNATRVGMARNGRNQFAEFGDPGTSEGFRSLALQDPYLMLDAAQDSPDWFITIGLNDRRVEPWMSAKFAAKALEKFGSRRLVFLRADRDAGHGVGSTRDQFVAEWADIYSFVLNRFGDPNFQAPATAH
jgi:prolyl oligopeptidase